MQSPTDLTRAALIPVAVACALLAVPAAHAVEIKAQVDWELDGVPGAGSPDIDGPAGSGFVDVLDSDFDGPGNSIFYHTFGDVSGNFGSRVSGEGSYDITGKFTYKETLVATSTMPMFSFTVIPGEIRAEQFYSASSLPVPAGLDIFSRYEIDIRVDGTSIWDSSAEVQVTDSGATGMETGTNSLGGAFTVTQPDFANYSWTTFMDTIGLGTFALGDTFLLEYDLTTLSRSNAAPMGCMGGDPGEMEALNEEYGYGSCGTGISRSGDPFGIGPPNSASVSGAVPVTVPEPASIAVLAAGLLGLGAARRRQRR